jgi:hypothetical protein
MELDRQHYVSCLRWKQGEYQALYRLSSDAQDSIVPLIEVAEIGFDFETQTNAKSIDDHLARFAKRVRDKWGRRQCFVDLRHIDCSQHMADGRHAMTFIFDDLRSKGALATPVIGLEQDSECQVAVGEVVANDNRGLCLRINIEEVAKPDPRSSIDEMLEMCEVDVEQCDLILDLGAPNFEPINGFAGLLHTLITNLPYLDLWRSFGLIGTSFPLSMGEVASGPSIIPRNEWRLYKRLVARLGASGIRIPSFGDYAINHPRIVRLDWRVVKPYASVRYTIDDGWLIVRGQNVRDHKFGQYRELCQAVVSSKHYCGSGFSEGDEYIYKCARGIGPTGNLTVWRRVGTNHHLEKVVQDVATFAASSDTP